MCGLITLNHTSSMRLPILSKKAALSCTKPWFTMAGWHGALQGPGTDPGLPWTLTTKTQHTWVK